MPAAAMWVNVEVAVVRHGRYLAIERAAAESYGGGWLCFPGGTVEPEAGIGALEQTARREVLEEVGLVLDGEVVYVESHVFLIDEQPVLDVVMLARADDGEARAVAADEVASVAWLTAAEMANDPRTQAWSRESLALAEAKRLALGW